MKMIVNQQIYLQGGWEPSDIHYKMSLNPELSKRKMPMKRKGEDRERKREIKNNSGSTNRYILFSSFFFKLFPLTQVVRIRLLQQSYI
jgi:hypothetical protein